MNKLVIVILLAGVGCIAVEPRKNLSTSVGNRSDSLYYEGRILHEKDSSTLYYSGSGVTFRFRGTGAKATLRDEKGENYFNIVVDDSIHYIRIDTIKKDYDLSQTPLKDTIHTISILKRNEWATGKTWFYGISLATGGELLAAPKKSRTIEFFGNSITAGYAIDDNSGGDSPDSVYTNNYYTYAAITARHFNANYVCTAKSGIGIMVSWFPAIMPEIYDRLDPLDSTSKWDFNLIKPEIVVINLFQNDSWIVNLPDHESFKQRFGTKAPGPEEIINAYKDFVTKIRRAYPEAHIICALGSMDATKEGSPWPGYVQAAVKALDDSKIYTHFFPFIEKPGHPRRDDNVKMARSLIQFIEREIWK